MAVGISRSFTAILAVILSMAILAGAHLGWLYYHSDVESISQWVEIRIAPGMTLPEVRGILVEEEILSHPRLFSLVGRITGWGKEIKSGRYLFREGESVATIFKRLTEGAVNYQRLVIPEGYMLKEIAGWVGEQSEIDSASFHRLATDPRLVDSLGVEAQNLEGYLFPDTYFLNWPVDTRELIERMFQRFQHVMNDSLKQRADSLGFSVKEMVTLASIIQAEAVYDSEMPRISAVYHNRLERRMRLEADPTVAYALGGVRRKLWTNDLRVRSPYNTYRVSGLPPGPICSPGKSAILAALYPLPGCRELYFVATGDGRHAFSETYREHLRVKWKIKRGKYNPPDDEGQAGAGDSDGSNSKGR
jgi:UPF0755 protein